VCISIGSNALEGSYSYQVTVTDAVSNITAYLNVTHLVVRCDRIGLYLTPSTLAVRILGP